MVVHGRPVQSGALPLVGRASVGAPLQQLGHHRVVPIEGRAHEGCDAGLIGQVYRAAAVQQHLRVQCTSCGRLVSMLGGRPAVSQKPVGYPDWAGPAEPSQMHQDEGHQQVHMVLWQGLHTSTTSLWPLRAARIRGVSPLCPTALGLARPASSVLVAGSYPPPAASCSAVSPRRSTASGMTACFNCVHPPSSLFGQMCIAIDE